jgi:hypothetical protein
MQLSNLSRFPTEMGPCVAPLILGTPKTITNADSSAASLALRLGVTWRMNKKMRVLHHMR